MNKLNSTKKILIFMFFLLIVVLIVVIYFLLFNEKKNKDILNTNTITSENFSQDNNISNTNVINDVQNVIKETNENETIEQEDFESDNTDKKDTESKYNNIDSSQTTNSTKTPNENKEDSNNITSFHKHTWVNHTKKVWIPNIVTIVDEPEKKIYGAQLYTEQPDGTWLSNGETYWFENGFTIEDLKEIIVDKMKNENYIGNYVNRTKTIPAKTHTEDKGHYEEQVDYQYCSECGERK